MTRKSRPSAKPNHHTRSDSSNSLLKKNAASLDQKRALPSASSFRSTSLFICIAVWEETKKAPCIAHRQYNATQTAGCCSHCRSQVSLDMKHLETNPPFIAQTADPEMPRARQQSLLQSQHRNLAQHSRTTGIIQKLTNCETPRPIPESTKESNAGATREGSRKGSPCCQAGRPAWTEQSGFKNDAKHTKCKKSTRVLL